MINNRILIIKAGVRTDHSVSLNSYHSSADVIALDEGDSILLGSEFRFNHRHFEVATPNEAVCSAQVSLWDGNLWQSAVDLQDQTSASGASLSQSGILSWVPDRSKSWSKEAESSRIPELSGTSIYDLYWVKITFTEALTAETALSYVGHKFSNDDDLSDEYPDLVSDTALSAFGVGKENWKEQTLSAAEYVVQALREKGAIISSDQILDSSVFKKASVHKVAEIIFTAFGKDYIENKREAQKAFHSSMVLKSYSVDKDGDARISQDEHKPTQTRFITR